MSRPSRTARAVARLTTLALAVGICVTPTASAAAEPPTPSSPVQAVNQSSNDAASGHPEIAAADANVYQAWTDFGVDPRHIGQVLLKVSHDDGTTWPISRHVSRGLPYSEEPDVAAAGDDAWVVWQTTTDVDDPSKGGREVYLQAMRDGGKRPEPYQNLSLDHQDSVEPQVVTAPGGWVLVTWRGLRGDVHLAWSDDGGREFRRMRIAEGALGGDIAVADGTAYVVTSAPGSTGIDVTPVRLQRPGPGKPLVAGAPVRVVAGERLGNPHVEAWGATVHATWMDASGPRPVTMYARSLDRGATWQQPQQMTAPGAVGGYGDLQVDERGVWVSSTMFGRGTTVQHSADLGGSWAAPVELGGVNRGAHAVFSDPSGPARTTPSPTLDWTMPDRYGRDRNGDGMVDYDVSPEFLRPSSYAVDLDACGTTGGDSPVVTYAWTVNGSTTETGTCRTRREYPSEGTFPTKVEVTTADGDSASTVLDVVVKDHLVISLGDSVASGEGVPDIPGTGTLGTDAVWQDKRCHRSAHAGPALGAKRLEDSDKRSSVTFLHLACSGASVMEDVFNGLPISGGGILTPYEGQVMTHLPLLPPQLVQAQEMTSGRDVDAVLVSIGANDQKFSKVVEGCIKTQCGPGTQIETDFLARNARLPHHYAALANQLHKWVSPDRVYLTEYFDPTHDQTGAVNLRCVAAGPKEVVHDDETQWAFDEVMTRLNAGVRSGSVAHGWNFVGGISDAFSPHGYCAQDGWVVQIGESFRDQGGQDGGFHPNRTGHQHYGRQIGAALAAKIPATPAPAVEKEPGREDTGGDIHLAWEDGMALQVSGLTAEGGAVTAKPAVRLPASPLMGGDDVSLVSVGTGVIASYVDNQAPRVTGNMRWWEVMAARVQTVAENLRVVDADLVQGPDDAAFAVAGKSTAVRAEILSTLPVRRYATVRMTVARTATGPVTSETLVALSPGLNVVHLHGASDFAPSADMDRFTAEVTVDSNGQVQEHSETDNTRQADPLPVRATRPLRLLFVPLQQTGESATSCDAVQQSADTARPYLQSALPVADGALTADTSCTMAVRVPGSAASADLTATLGVLDAMAAQTGYDAVVGVARSGWFGERTNGATGAIGAALAGSEAAARSGVVVEAGFGGPLVAHEVAHLLGAEHKEEPASGYWVAQRRVRDNLDVLHPAYSDARWVGAGTFGFVADRLGSEAATRAASDSSLLVSGVLRHGGTFDADAFGRVDLPPTVPLGAQGDVRLQYLAGDGDELGSVGLPVSAGVTAGAESTTVDRSVAARVPLVDGTARLRVVRGDEVLLDRAVTAAAPAVTVTKPAASSVAPGTTVDVTWTASDPDSTTLSHDLAMSTDGGSSWTPLARGLTGTSAQVLLGQQLVGKTVLLRVTTSDGVNSTPAQSPPVAVQAPTGPEKVVAELRHKVRIYDSYWGEWRTVTWNGLWTMNPDGSELTHLTKDLKAANDPEWSPDGSTVAFVGSTPFGGSAVALIKGDGTGYRLLEPATPGKQGDCPTWSPDGKKLAFVFGREVWTMNADGSGAVALTGAGRDPVLPDGKGPILSAWCPAWSPDGTTIAFLAARDGYDDDLFVVDADGTDLRRLPGDEKAGSSSDEIEREHGLMVDVTADNEVVFQRYDGFFASRTDGTGFRKLFANDGPRRLTRAQLTPDGTRLIGQLSGGMNGADVGTVRLDGTQVTAISRFPRTAPFYDAVNASLGQLRTGGGEEPPPPPAPALADAGGPYTAVEGQPVLLDATSGLRPGGQIPSYEWDLDGDGAYDDATGPAVRFVPTRDGRLGVGLQVTTSTGQVARDDADVQVADAPASLDVAAGRAVAGSSFGLALRVDDPGVDDTHVATVAWGDGEISSAVPVDHASGRLLAEHTYAAAGTRTAQVTVCDTDEPTSCATTAATVQVLASAAPTVVGSLPRTGPKNGGTQVRVTGELLSGATAVLFGGTPATGLQVVSDRELVVTAPAMPADGPVDVTVVARGSTSAPCRPRRGRR
jgi:hypothetical protein